MAGNIKIGSAEGLSWNAGDVPGSIELVVPNSAAADDRTVRVQMEGDGVSVVDSMVGSQRWSRIGLKPGHYRVIVSAQAGKLPINDQDRLRDSPGRAPEGGAEAVDLISRAP